MSNVDIREVGELALDDWLADLEESDIEIEVVSMTRDPVTHTYTVEIEASTMHMELELVNERVPVEVVRQYKSQLAGNVSDAGDSDDTGLSCPACGTDLPSAPPVTCDCGQFVPEIAGGPSDG